MSISFTLAFSAYGVLWNCTQSHLRGIGWLKLILLRSMLPKCPLHTFLKFCSFILKKNSSGFSFLKLIKLIRKSWKYLIDGVSLHQGNSNNDQKKKTPKIPWSNRSWCGLEQLIRGCCGLGQADLTVRRTAGTVLAVAAQLQRAVDAGKRCLQRLCCLEEKLLAIQQTLVPTWQQFQSAGSFLHDRNFF